MVHAKHNRAEVLNSNRTASTYDEVGEVRVMFAGLVGFD